MKYKISQMETLIIHSESKKIRAIVEILKAFDISFELKKTQKEKVYDSEFVNKILSRSKSKDFVTVKNVDNIWESIL